MNINSVLENISQKTRAISVFLWGSRARGDAQEDSDWELGALFRKEHLISEYELRQLANAPDNVSIYPYEYNLFICGEIVVPFQRSLYLREIKLTAKTLLGEKVVESFSPPPITIVDLLCDLKFALGRASDAIVSFRRGDKTLAARLFFKSCMFATRDWLIFAQKYFPTTYHEINEMANSEYAELVHKAYSGRFGAIPEEYLLLDNIHYINAFIEEQIELEYHRNGNVVLIP